MLPLTAPRYTATPFPPYSFVPGQTPHPYLHPAGHGMRPAQVSGTPVALPASERWRDSAVYLFSCDLYNSGYWWEAHEGWESLWRLTDRRGVHGRFYKLLIQVTAAHLVLRMGNMEAADALVIKAESNAGAIAALLGSPTLMGLRVAEWIAEVREYYDRLLQTNATPPRHDPRFYPLIRLCAS